MKVNNISPIVEAGADITTDEGTAITFNGNFSDPGILDTHTISWDFGDGTTTNILNPSHTYTKDGVYTATLTVQKLRFKGLHDYSICVIRNRFFY